MTLEDDLSNLDGYLAYIMETDDITAKRLEVILDGVKEVEDDTTLKFSHTTEELVMLTNRLKAFEEQIGEAGRIAAQESALASLNEYAEDANRRSTKSDDRPFDISNLALDTPQHIAISFAFAQILGIPLPLTSEQQQQMNAYYQSNGDPLMGQGTKVTSPKDDPTRNHRGLDVAGPLGAPMVSCWEGEVVDIRYAEDDLKNEDITYGKDDWTYGRYVVIKTNLKDANGNIVYLMFGHMDMVNANLTVGSKVTKGTPLGTLGNTGHSSGPHLHFEARMGFGLNYTDEEGVTQSTAIDPMPYITLPPDIPYKP